MNVGGALETLFYAFVAAIGAAVILVIYVFWDAFFASTPWNVCSKMETDTAKIQCMEAHY